MDEQQQDMWSFGDVGNMLADTGMPNFDAGEGFPVPQSAPSSYGRPDSALENSPYPPMDGPLKPEFAPDGGLEKVSVAPAPISGMQSAGYSMGPGNEATGQDVFGEGMPQYQRFGDARGWVMGPSGEDPNNLIPLPWAVEGARPMGPTLQAIANSDRLGADLDRRGTNLGPILGSVLNRMGEIDAVNMRGQRYTPEYQQRFEQGWVDNARNNNLLTVRPEQQADGSINRVYTYESGRQASERYQAPPGRTPYPLRNPSPPPPAPPSSEFFTDPRTGGNVRMDDLAALGIGGATGGPNTYQIRPQGASMPAQVQPTVTQGQPVRVGPTSVITPPAGSSVRNNPDGTVTITAPDGRSATYRNGAKIG